MYSMYDAELWKYFQNDPTKPHIPFLRAQGHWNLALQLNMDGFQPHRRKQYSTAALYVVILNLPPHLRYKPENMITVGLLSNSSDIDGMLPPLIDDLLRWWDGVTVEMPDNT